MSNHTSNFPNETEEKSRAQKLLDKCKEMENSRGMTAVRVNRTTWVMKKMEVANE